MASVSRPCVPECLPVELWHKIFENMALDQILIVMRVCGLWRAVAIESAAYSSEIELISPTRSAVELFLLRLGRTASRQPMLLVTFQQPCELLSTSIMPAIEEYLSNIGGLSVKCHSVDARDVMDRLRRPAGQLRRLSLFFIPDERSYPWLPSMPSDLLANDAPHITFLALTNVEFPPDFTMRPLSSVLHLQIGYIPSFADSDGRELSEYLWRYFPALTILTLMGRTDLSHPIHRDPKTWRRIKQLHLALHRINAHDLFSEMPFLQTFPVIEMSYPYHTKLLLSLPHIPGPLDMAIRQATLGRSQVCLTDRNTHISRAFTGLWSPNFDFQIRCIFDTLGTCDRILSLSIANLREWIELAAMERPFNQLDTLRLILECPARLMMLATISRPIECPALSTLVLRSGSSTMATLPCDEVAKFTEMALPFPHDEKEPRLSLVLENVTLVGPRDVLHSHFRQVRHEDLSTWSYPFPHPPA